MAELVLQEYKKRFLVTDKVEHGCCYTHSVVDTTKPDKYLKGEFERLCECYTHEDARRIEEAMNRMFPLDA